MVYALCLLPINDIKGNPIRVSSDDWCFKKIPGSYKAIQPHKYTYGYIPLRKDLFSEFKQEKHIAYRQCLTCRFRQVLVPSFEDFRMKRASWQEESIA